MTGGRIAHFKVRTLCKQTILTRSVSWCQPTTHLMFWISSRRLKRALSTVAVDCRGELSSQPVFASKLLHAVCMCSAYSCSYATSVVSSSSLHVLPPASGAKVELIFFERSFGGVFGRTKRGDWSSCFRARWGHPAAQQSHFGEDVHHSMIGDLFLGSAESRRRLAIYCLKAGDDRTWAVKFSCTTSPILLCLATWCVNWLQSTFSTIARYPTLPKANVSPRGRQTLVFTKGWVNIKPSKGFSRWWNQL